MTCTTIADELYPVGPTPLEGITTNTLSEEQRKAIQKARELTISNDHKLTSPDGFLRQFSKLIFPRLVRRDLDKSIMEIVQLISGLPEASNTHKDVMALNRENNVSARTVHEKRATLLELLKILDPYLR